MKEKESVSDFVSDNAHLFTVVGIFAAISVYFSTFKFIGGFISFITFALFLILCFELLTKYIDVEPDDRSVKLQLFGLTFLVFVILVSGYLVSIYFLHFVLYSYIIVLISIIFLINKAKDKFTSCKYMKQLKKTSEQKYNLYNSLFLIISLCLLFLLLFLYNYILDQVFNQTHISQTIINYLMNKTLNVTL
ncbi:hypothetical protein HQ533_06010 [Candidatus Woesearchaeota archaeon]|nr:hypothetical protein [Candidatus Woesearchaeota archaeon]